MLANGSPLETVDNLPLSDLKNLYAALQQGLWGPFKDYSIAQTLYCSLHAIRDTQVAVVMGKKHKPTKPLVFHELFPAIDEAASLGTGGESRKIKTENQIAKSAVVALGGQAPKWITDALG